VLGAPKHEVVLLYSGSSITGPTVGVLVGGFVTTAYMGGYTNKKALTLCFFVAACACISAFPMPLLDEVIPVIACLWLVLFFGGFIMPNLTGILLNSVPSKERAVANSVANFFYNCLGYLPAPFVYGLVCKFTAKYDRTDIDCTDNPLCHNTSRAGMAVILWSSIIGVVSLGVAILLRKHSKKMATENLKRTIQETY